jgi:hypothetical protein
VTRDTTVRTLDEKTSKPHQKQLYFEGWFTTLSFTEPVEWPLTLPYNT